ncbi:hypothetical protein IGI96_003550 [Enterococcus sp. DIV0421]
MVGTLARSEQQNYTTSKKNVYTENGSLFLKLLIVEVKKLILEGKMGVLLNMILVMLIHLEKGFLVWSY